MDLHPYDGKERRYRHTDSDMTPGVRIVMGLLHLPAPPSASGLLYDLSFYSGGIGVMDRLAITLPRESPSAPIVLATVPCKPPEEIASDPSCQDDFLWLIDDEDDPLPVRAAAARFINENRQEFQPECQVSGAMWFVAESNVNTWTALWETDGVLSYLSYDQG